jgi:putative IMPACT (imprinted ancient) family translation regulator
MALKEIITEDRNLDEDKDLKYEFISYAQMFDNDLEANLELTSIQLNEKYATDNVSGWRKFLKHNSVRKYVNDFLDEIAEKSAQRRLSEDVEKTGDALKVKAMIDAKSTEMENNRFILWFVPQKDYLSEPED